MSNKLLSIITINYNDAVGLKKTMDSVFEQTYQDYEYIIIDGGSSDGSKEYIKKHQDRLAYWVSEPDHGIYNAMNKGTLKATGEYIQFLNSGDWFYNPGVIKKMIPNLNNCDAIYGHMVKVYPDESHKVDKGPEGSTITLDTFLWSTLNHGATFIKRNLFEKYGLYNEELKIVSDWSFFLKALGLHTSVVTYIDMEILYFDMTGISNDNITLRNIERTQVLEKELSKKQYKLFLRQQRGEKYHPLIHKILRIPKKIMTIKSKLGLK